MVEPSARIRLYRPSDDKLVRFTLGKAVMEGLAVANRRAAFHPLTLSIWVALSSIMVQLLDWWPKPSYGWLGYLAPLPAFGCWAMPTLYLVDWINRPYFDDTVMDTLRRPDIVDIPKYYARSPSSGFFILEYGDNFVGLIAIDASRDSTSTKTLTAKDSTRAGFQGMGTSRVATIRHFYVEEPFRKTMIQNDLLQHAIQHAFAGGDTVQAINAVASPLVDYVQNSLRDNGFKHNKDAGKVGIYRWTVTNVVVRRENWEQSGPKANVY
ncbi:hypothetical protein BV22DRAFT_1124432 [Leucogyrophana mollusca]|uniref:Uncharacterized protein n=1 Tax=Leucogyrophana mollusca TaxID=85980 RepID=A0ACB8C0J8_9AGAM|nr:hypothetical protein BV22DRAFT_1124432 [Leucogyrophana mollusca]